MKKIILLLLLVSGFINAQEKNVWLFQIHEMEVSGNVNDFIKDQKEFHKKLAVLGVETNEWAGWSCMRSVSSGNKFIFIHHFNSVEQRINPQIWTQENIKKLELKAPEGNTYTAKTTAPIYMYEGQMGANDKEPSKYWKINQHKFTNTSEYIKHNRLWGEMVVKEAQKNVDGMNWGFGTLLSHAEMLDSKSLIYNGISFDGFGTLEEMLNSQLYNDEMNPLVTKWYDETQKQGFINSQYGGKSELWIEIDTTF